MKKKRSLFTVFFLLEPVQKVLAALSKTLVKLLLSTLRIDYEGVDAFLEHARRNEASSEKNPLIVALWHNQLLLVPLLDRFPHSLHYSVLISKSRDGDIPTRIAESFPHVKVIRVTASSRHQALCDAFDALHNDRILLITPDGPRGPKHVLKEGVIALAEKTKASIIPLKWHSSKMWHLNTWDTFCIPRPFSKITFILGEPLRSDNFSGKDELKEALSQQLTGNA